MDAPDRNDCHPKTHGPTSGSRTHEGTGAPAGTDREIFSAVITPHRSLSRRGFIVFMCVLGGVSFTAGIVFLSMGAWPVFGFFGLDVLLVWFAFRANYRAARARETIVVTESDLLVRRVSARGAVAEWRFNPYWVRIDTGRDHEGTLTRLSLASHGRKLDIAYWLSPPEKTEFMHALAGALATARRGLPD
ncbi:DUF2244 domain-containing protein [Microbaculum marinum]|uniref:DUF2244 domain-containing protein n=1 Tax=Microbaculum marinum TaxID=1764581 RepID=A0AAW9RXE0_9HYPH